MTSEKSQATAAPVLEWIAAAIGLALILFVAAVIGREAWVQRDTHPPAIEVRAVNVAPAPGGFLVEFEARNRSAETAAAVSIEGRLGEETSTATLDYVAGESSARGGLFFTGDPRTRPLTLRAMGYEAP